MTARVQVAARVCECCQATFERRRFPSGQLERLSQFAERRFCSRACFRKSAADRQRVRPVGEWITQPYALNGQEGGFEEPTPLRAVSGRYPWDRQRAPSGDAFPGHFSAGRQQQVPASRREA